MLDAHKLRVCLTGFPFAHLVNIMNSSFVCCRTKDGGIGRALVDGTYEGLQRISLSTCMITDHLANSYYEGLGQDNLTNRTFVEEGKMPAPDQDAKGEGGETDGAEPDQEGDEKDGGEPDQDGKGGNKEERDGGEPDQDAEEEGRERDGGRPNKDSKGDRHR